MKYTIGAKVKGTDGTCGELRRIIIDPVDQRVTHLVVEPRHRKTGGHLVPIELVASVGDHINLGCTTMSFTALEEAEESRFVPGACGQWANTQDEMMSWPYFPSKLPGTPRTLTPEALDLTRVTTHRVPFDEVEVKRGDRVHAVDGDVGKIRGLVMDRGTRDVTHVLLEQGHLWGGEAREIAVPMASVTKIDVGVRLNLTKVQVRNLPPIVIDLPA